MRLIIFTIFTIGTLTAKAQEFIRELDVPVYENEELLRNPWAGGLNYLQYSTMDVDLDGKEDLFIFDRSSNKVLTFRNESEEVGEVNYKYAPEYESFFPEGLRNWVLLRDFNCDGLKDLFTSGSGGMKMYEQSVNGGEVTFTQVYDNLIPALYGFSQPYNAPLYNISVDLPHIGDIDDDGDMDILTFSDGSLNVFYYINNASEMGRCDTMALELANRCYGFISESSENNTIFLEHECNFNVVNPRTFRPDSNEEQSNRDGLHTGGTLLSLDTNGDGYFELIIGDITNDSLIMTTNGPSVQGPDSMIMQTGNFPANISDTEKIAFYEFPGAYYEDFNNDGVKDLASSSFSSFSSLDDFGSWLYINNGATDNPDFALQKRDWLQDEMIEVGTNAMPVIFDYNADGLGDLVVGNRKTITDAQNSVSKLRLYENVGSETAPEFELRDEDWLNISALSIENIYPTFGDIDADGDMDMILGESSGKIHFFENSAGPGNTVSLAFAELSVEDVNGEDIDPGADVIPQLIDIDQDGLLELIIGEQWGNLNLYENVGTAEAFEFELVNEEFGGVYVDNLLTIQGNNAPHFYMDENDEWVLLTGNELGNVQRWNNISGNLDGTFTEIDSVLVDINDGQFSVPFIYDIDADGFQDLFIGNERGGVTLYRGQFVDDIVEIQLPEVVANIYPNPSTGLVNINFSNAELPNQISVVNLLGEEVRHIPVTTQITQIDLSSEASGIYLLVGEFTFGRMNVGKVVVEE